MKTVKMNDILFARSQKPIQCLPGINTKSECPPGTLSCPIRTQKPQKMTYNLSMLYIDAILSGKVAACMNSVDGVLYVELGEYRYIYEIAANTVYYKNNPAEAAANNEKGVITFLGLTILLAIGARNLNVSLPVSAFSYTKAAFNQLMDKIGANSAGYFCDCMYYETARTLDKISVETLSPEKEGELRQSVKLGNFSPYEGTAEGLIKSPFDSLTESLADKKEKKKAGISPAMLRKKARKGEFLIDYNWGEKSRSHIIDPSFLDTYVPCTAFKKVLTLINKKTARVLHRLEAGKTGLEAIENDYINMILTGRPGTGKTSLGEAICAATGLPCYTVKNSAHTEEDNFEGMTKVSEGSFAFKETAFLEAYTNGGVVLLEEFNLADPAVLMGALGQAIEKPFILNRDGYEEVRRHPLCIIIGTMNVGTQGSKAPSEAFSSRLPWVFRIDDPSDNDFVKILQSISEGSKEDCFKIFSRYKAILKYINETLNEPELALCCTLRHCIAAVQLLKEGICDSANEAIYDTVIGSLALKDLALADEIYEAAVTSLPE